MRQRHIPRVCRACHAPMARQEDTCWRCGTRSASDDGPRTTLTVNAGRARVDERPDPAIAGATRAVSDARADADRWTNEGGSFVTETAARLRWARSR
jgi:hypothetical protein